MASFAYGLGGRLGSASGTLQWLKVQWVVCLGLMPLTLFFFHQVSLVMLFANMLAIPWVGMIIVPMCLVASLSLMISNGLGQSLFYLAGKLLLPLWCLLQWLSELPVVTAWHHEVTNSFILLTSVLAVALWLAPQGWPARCLGFIWALPFLLYRVPSPPPTAAWLTLLDVGQGLSVIVRTAHHLLVYDAGPRFFGGFDAGQSVVIPYLYTINAGRIDKMIISHSDNDHSGGARAILKHWQVNDVLTSAPYLFAKDKTVACRQGQVWTWDGVKFSMLYPAANQPYKNNNSSCVLRIEVGHRAILLTGDIEQSAEKVLLDHDSAKLHAQVVVVPHHGSRTSSTEAFVKKVKAQYALFPVGFYNLYHFPAKTVVNRYRESGARILTTAADGAITIHLPEQGPIEVEKENRPHRHFWQW